MEKRKKTLILIHGLYSFPWMLKWIGQQLEKKFEVVYFGHNSVRYGDSTMHSLHELVLDLNKQGIKKVVLAGHSMGGLLAKKYSQMHGDKLHYIVTFGTPHNGSKLGKILDSFGLIGSAGESGITRKITEETKIPFLNIVGIIKNPFLQKTLPLLAESDGTVHLNEATTSHATKEVIVDATHLGLLTCEEVVDEILRFDLEQSNK